MSTLDCSAFALEFGELRRLLTATVPSYVARRQSLQLPQGSPPLMRLFWENVGWLDAFESVLVRPDDGKAMEGMTALLGAWRADDERGDGSYDSVLQQLPPRHRVVSLGDEHVTITDECDAEADPPLVVIHGPSTDAEGPLHERQGQRYLAEVTFLVLESVRLETRVKGALQAHLPDLAEILPQLMPGSRRAQGVWLLANVGIEANAPTRFDLRAASMGAVVSLLEQLASDTQLAWTCHDVPARRARQVPLPTSLRRWAMQHPVPHVLHTGLLEHVPVMIVQPANPHELLAIHCDPEQLIRVDHWFATHRPLS